VVDATNRSKDGRILYPFSSLLFFLLGSGMKENERILVVLLSVLCRVLFPMTFAKYRDNCKAISSLSLLVCYSYDISLVVPFIVVYLLIFQYLKHVRKICFIYLPDRLKLIKDFRSLYKYTILIGLLSERKQITTFYHFKDVIPDYTLLYQSRIIMHFFFTYLKAS
jgi:hypothetical protein